MTITNYIYSYTDLQTVSNPETNTFPRNFLPRLGAHFEQAIVWLGNVRLPTAILFNRRMEEGTGNNVLICFFSQTKQIYQSHK